MSCSDSNLLRTLRRWDRLRSIRFVSEVDFLVIRLFDGCCQPFVAEAAVGCCQPFVVEAASCASGDPFISEFVCGIADG